MFIGALVEDNFYVIPIASETILCEVKATLCQIKIDKESLFIKTPKVKTALPCSISLQHLQNKFQITFIVIPNLFEFSCKS